MSKHGNFGCVGKYNGMELHATADPSLVALAVEQALEERAHLHWYKEEYVKWVVKPVEQIPPTHKPGIFSRLSDFISRAIGS